MKNLFDFLKPKYICLRIFLLLLPLQSWAQCSVFSTPYVNTFDPGSNALACYNHTSGTLNVQHFVSSFNNAGYAAFDWQEVGGTSVLITPQIHIASPVYLNYAWAHRIYANTNLGFQDSFKVSVKRINELTWTVLKNYPAPFYSSSYSSSDVEVEDILLDNQYINDTIQLKFEFTSDSLSGTWLSLDDLRLAPGLPDSLFTLPYRQNFDGSSWRPDSAGGFTNQEYKIDPDWRAVPWDRSEVGGYRWVVQDDSTTSVGTGPVSDRSGTGNYIYAEASQPGENDAIIYTPYFDLSSQPFATLSFWYHMRGADMGTLMVEQLINAHWQLLDSISGQQQGAATDPWKKLTLLLDSTSRTQFRFRMKKKASTTSLRSITQDAAIDEFSLTPVSCPIPNNFELLFPDVAINTAEADWSAGPIANQYIIEYDTAGFIPGTGIIDTIPTNSVTLTNLQAQTTYDFYVRFICGSSDTSILMGPYSFTTACLALPAPYIETFNDTLIPECWASHNQLGPDVPNAAWKPTGLQSNPLVFPAYGATGQTDHTGNNGFAIGVDGSFPFPLDSIAIYSPFIDVSSLRKPLLSMWIFSNNTDYPGENNTFYLDVFDGAQWHYSTLIHAQDSADWVELTLALDQFQPSGPIRCRLVVDKDSMNAAFYNDIVIDDFSVTDAYGTRCSLPENMAITQIHCDSATLSWNSDTSIVESRIKYGPAGFDFLSSGTWVNNASSPYTLNNLQVGTGYDVYVVDSCTEGLGIQHISFTTDSTLLPIVNHNVSFHSAFGPFSAYLFDARNTLGGNSFSWDFGNGNIVQSDTAVWPFSQNGSYWIYLTVTNACGAVTDSINLIINDIGLEDAKVPGAIKLFPNPNDGRFEIECQSFKGETLQFNMWNGLGMQVFQTRLMPVENTYTFEINLPELVPGVYVLQIQDFKGNVFLKKMIVQ